MTAQDGEVAIYKRKKYWMATEPLNDYLETRGDIEFEPMITSCWRGYKGKWKIKYKKLYLVELIGILKNVPPTITFLGTMEYLFPGQKEVFAGWFTGEIRIPVGEMLDYVLLIKWQDFVFYPSQDGPGNAENFPYICC